MPNPCELERLEGDFEDVVVCSTTFRRLEEETIPTNVEGAVKYDSGKSRMELLPLPTLENIAKVMTFGANKYADNGWKSLPNADERYLGALLRHLAAIQKGEVLDPESGLPHIDHVACNAMFLSYFNSLGK